MGQHVLLSHERIESHLLPIWADRWFASNKLYWTQGKDTASSRLQKCLISCLDAGCDAIGLMPLSQTFSAHDKGLGVSQLSLSHVPHILYTAPNYVGRDAEDMVLTNFIKARHPVG